MGEVRRYDVGMSVDALAAAWARQEAAPAGSVVTVRTEISGRCRGGTPWTVGAPNGLMLAMVARPALAPRQEALLWLPVTLAAAGAIAAVSGRSSEVLWPDSVRGEDGLLVGATNVGVQLGPDRIDHAVLAVRVDLENAGITDAERLLDTVVEELTATVARLEADPPAVVEDFTAAYALMGRLVKVALLPRGSARGRVRAIDPNGDLVLESATGMLERIMAANLRTIEPA